MEHWDRSYQNGAMRQSVHLVEILHTSVSGCHSTSRFGEEDNIDRNSPKINRIAMIAPATILKPPYSEDLNGKLMANGSTDVTVPAPSPCSMETWIHFSQERMQWSPAVRAGSA